MVDCNFRWRYLKSDFISTDEEEVRHCAGGGKGWV